MPQDRRFVPWKRRRPPESAGPRGEGSKAGRLAGREAANPDSRWRLPADHASSVWADSVPGPQSELSTKALLIATLLAKQDRDSTRMVDLSAVIAGLHPQVAADLGLCKRRGRLLRAVERIVRAAAVDGRGSGSGR